MSFLSKTPLLVRAVWIFLAIMAALYVLAMVLGGAAWSGVNVAVVIYLLFAACGFIGLLIGSASVISGKSIYSWIAGVGALFITGLTLIFIYGYIRAAHDEKVAMNSWDNSFLGLHAPDLAFYLFSLVASAGQVLLSGSKINHESAVR